MINAYTVTVGLVASVLALAALPCMVSRSPRLMMAGVLLSIPFVAFMTVFTFAR